MVSYRGRVSPRCGRESLRGIGDHSHSFHDQDNILYLGNISTSSYQCHAGFFINDKGFPKFLGTRLGVPAVRIGLCRYRREGGP